MRRVDENLKCYFDKDLVCIGTIDDFYGDYYVNEYYKLPFTVNPIGKSARELGAIQHEFNMARIAFDFKQEEEKAYIKDCEEHTNWQEAQIRVNYHSIL
jgi:hypothetical protein